MITKTITIYSKVVSKRMPLPSSIIIGVALLVVVSISIINGVPSAAALEQIHASHDVSAPVDRVWNIISNLGNDTTWNQANTLKIIQKTGNEIQADTDRKSTRLNSSHGYISYAVFCLKKKK